MRKGEGSVVMLEVAALLKKLIAGNGTQIQIKLILYGSECHGHIMAVLSKQFILIRQ